jgi:glycosyltransferase involved in cell wall biosynthesis
MQSSRPGSAGPLGPAPPRIATLYTPERAESFEITKMSSIRWVRISEALARLGYRVDLLSNARERPRLAHPRARVRPLDGVDWSAYDAVKTCFHKGFETLVSAGGAGHPLILSKLGSVVGAVDEVPGVHFLGEEREELYRVQCAIAGASRYVAVLTEQSRRLWEAEHANGRGPVRVRPDGGGERLPGVLSVPTGVDRDVPPPRRNPYAGWGAPVVVYIGNLYDTTQLHVNALWQERLNALGRELRRRGIRLCFVGPGTVDRLDPELVTAVGPVPVDEMWDWQRFAAAGVVLAQGPVQHNESSKIYYYLRTGLPVVSESSVPNNHVIEVAGLGAIVPYGDDRLLADAVEDAVRRRWDREAAIRHVLEHHTWEHRAAVYDRVIRRELGLPETT